MTTAKRYPTHRSWTDRVITPNWLKWASVILLSYALGLFTPYLLANGLLPLGLLGQAGWAQDNGASNTTPIKALTPTQRYNADLRLCADEPSGSARLQCRRDAKAEMDAANAALKNIAKPAVPAVACPDCGRVSAVSITEKEGESSALGMIGGGLVGGLLGNQMGGGIGKDIATVAGAVGGAYAGKEIEKRAKSHKVWSVTVRFDTGNSAKFDFTEDPGYAVGDAVQRSGNSLMRR
jgi:outer membrane lipoprotein SlyB